MPYTPGSGAENAGYAVTYGDLGETNRMNLVRMLDQQNQARQDQIDAQQKADAAHKFALQKYYGKEFDPSNFDTGTDLNKSINDALIQGKKNLAEILNDPNSSDQDIDNAAQQALTPAMKLYQIGTAVKRNIDTSMSGLQNDKTLAPYLGSLKKQAFINALYTKDPKTGNIRLKNDQELSQIDPNQNFAADILQNNPQLVMNGNVDWNAQMKKFTPKTFSNSGEYYSSPGVKRSGSYKADYYDLAQKIVKDHKGIASVETASDPIITKDENGNPVKIDRSPQYVVDALQSTPGEKANLDVATMHYMAQHTPEVSAQPGTPAFENAKAIMVYNALNKLSPKLISSADKVNMAPLVIREQMGIPMPGSGGNGKDSGQMNKPDVSASFKDINGADFQSSDGKVNGTIQNGVFQPEKKSIFSPLFGGGYKAGTEMTGTIPVDKLPASVYKAAQSYISNNDITGETEPILDADGKLTGKERPTGRVKVKIGADGQIQAIRTDKGWFDVGDRENANVNLLNKTRSIKNKIQGTLPDAQGKKNAAHYGL